MQSASECRRYASMLRQMARIEPEFEAQFLQIAETWLLIAAILDIQNADRQHRDSRLSQHQSNTLH